ncbi:hypothetical protein RSAG8_11199, partial [Rhizoctonia solani AG-8 WAC10335]
MFMQIYDPPLEPAADRQSSYTLTSLDSKVLPDTRIKSIALTCTQGSGDPIEDIQRCITRVNCIIKCHGYFRNSLQSLDGWVNLTHSSSCMRKFARPSLFLVLACPTHLA